MRRILEEEGLSDKVQCDSAGTISFHQGSPPDRRMRDAAAKRGYRLEGRARGIEGSDLEAYDLILTMDADNLSNTRQLDPTGTFTNKIQPMCGFCREYAEKEVPDPYYGGDNGFEHVMDILEDACGGLLAYIREEWKL